MQEPEMCVPDSPKSHYIAFATTVARATLEATIGFKRCGHMSARRFLGSLRKHYQAGRSEDQ